MNIIHVRSTLANANFYAVFGFFSPKKLPMREQDWLEIPNEIIHNIQFVTKVIVWALASFSPRKIAPTSVTSYVNVSIIYITAEGMAYFKYFAMS